MDTPAEFVPLAGGDSFLLPQTADVETVGEALGRAVVPRGQDPFFQNEYCADLTAQTGGPGGYQIRNPPEIVIP